MNCNILLTILSAAVAQETSQTTTANDVIGVGGIIVTLVVGLLTCLVTWKTAMKSIKQKKLTYSRQVYPFLSDSVTKRTELTLSDFEIKYLGELLENPCLLTIEIVNSGNEAIENPPITIRSNEKIEIIPAYFEDIPNGYEDKWILKKYSHYSCDIDLKHINPMQCVKARFLLDKPPTEEIIFECPMPNVQIQEVPYIDTNDSFRKIPYSKNNLLLIVITVILFATIDRWSYYISDLFWKVHLNVPAEGTAIFVMSTLLLAIIINTYGIQKVDIFLINHTKLSAIIKIVLTIISIALLVMIIFNYAIVGFIPQAVAAIFIVISLALLIHFSFVTKKLV